MGKYDDIINMSRPLSKNRKQMPLNDRAAQFSSFAALTGHKEAISETARETEEKIVVDDSSITVINNRLQYIHRHKDENIEAKVCFFQKDARKAGGKYIEIQEVVEKIDTYGKEVLLRNGTSFKIEDILSIDIIMPLAEEY